MEGLEFNNWGKMSVTDTIFGRWSLLFQMVFTLDKEGGNNGAQTYNTYQYHTISVTEALDCT